VDQPAAGHQLPAASKTRESQPTTDYRLPTTEHRLPAAAYCIERMTSDSRNFLSMASFRNG